MMMTTTLSHAYALTLAIPVVLDYMNIDKTDEEQLMYRALTAYLHNVYHVGG